MEVLGLRVGIQGRGCIKDSDRVFYNCLRAGLYTGLGVCGLGLKLRVLTTPGEREVHRGL